MGCYIDSGVKKSEEISQPVHRVEIHLLVDCVSNRCKLEVEGVYSQLFTCFGKISDFIQVNNRIRNSSCLRANEINELF